MYCKKCGKPLFNEQEFCSACSSRVNAPSDTIFTYVAIPSSKAKHGCMKDIFVDGCVLPTRLYLHSPKGLPFTIKSTILMNVNGINIEKPLSVQVAIISDIPKRRTIWKWLWIPLAALATLFILLGIKSNIFDFDTLNIESGIVYDEPDPYK